MTTSAPPNALRALYLRATVDGGIAGVRGEMARNVFLATSAMMPIAGAHRKMSVTIMKAPH